jgi:parallel beta-helix repeat protein
MDRKAQRTNLNPNGRPTTRRRARLRLEALEGRWVPSTITVDDDRAQKPDPNFTTITAALNAASPGDTIQVYDGTYREALAVTKNGVKFLAAGSAVNIVSPATLTPVTIGADNIGAALIDVEGATNVVVNGFRIDGSANTDSNLAAGVRVIGNGSATVVNDTITGLVTTNNPSAFGIGVQVGTHRGGGSAGTAKVQNDAISNYLGVGVLVDGPGSAATVRDNAITGQGTTAAVPQYGVQVSNCASARVEFNTITANNFHNDPNTVAAGVLVYNTDKQTVVARNTIDANQTGVYVWISSKTQILSNDITNSGNSGGVVLDTTTNSLVADNDVCGSAGDGIDLYSASSNRLFSNDVHNAAQDGIYVFASNNNLLNVNDVFANGDNGIHLENSSGNTMNDTGSFGNGRNGVYILGGQSNTLKSSASALNIQDGVRLENTQSNAVLGSIIALNGGVGVRLINSQNTTISNDIIVANAGGNVSIDPASTGTVISNSTIGPADARESRGSAFATLCWLGSAADCDAVTAGL